MASTLKVDILQDSGGNNLVTSNGSGVVTAAGFGKIGQVVEATTTTNTSTTGTTYVDTDLSASITPTSTSSKILCMLSGDLRARTGNGYNVTGKANIVRGSTQIAEGTINIDGESSTYDPKVASKISLIKLDSPATTSATTYKVQIKSQNSSYSPTINFSSFSESVLILMEVLP